MLADFTNILQNYVAVTGTIIWYDMLDSIIEGLLEPGHKLNLFA